jgi:hypothetical protein
LIKGFAKGKKGGWGGPTIYFTTSFKKIQKFKFSKINQKKKKELLLFASEFPPTIPGIITKTLRKQKINPFSF